MVQTVLMSDSAAELVNVGDGWGNILTGLGRADRDKRLSTEFGVPTVLSETQLDRLYAGDWRISRIVDRPASDQIRRWLDVVVDGRRDRADKIHLRLRELGAKAAFRDGIGWSRLHGTALGIVFADDGQPMETPLVAERVRHVESIRVVDRWDLSVSTYVGDAQSPNHGMPEAYRVNSRIIDYRGQPIAPTIHASRVLRWDGVRTSRRRMQELGGWADSVVARVYDVVRDWAHAIGGAAHLTTDFAQAVFRIKGLAKMLSEDKDKQVIARIQLLDMARSIARLVPIDSEEEFVRQPTPVSGLPELLDRLRDELCGAADLPEKILFGKATAGLGDQGQSDLEQYYNGIEGEQERNVIPQATQLVAMLVSEQAFKATAWEVQPRPLWTPTDTQVSENQLRDAQADAIRVSNSIMSPDEIREARYGGDSYRADLQIETGAEGGEDHDEEGEDDELLEPGQENPLAPEDVPGETPSPAAVPGKLDPETTLNGAQISAAIEIVAKVLTREITPAAARVIARVGLGLKQADVEAMLEGTEELIIEKEAKAAEIQERLASSPAPAVPPGSKPPGVKLGEKPTDENNPSPEDDDGKKVPKPVE